MNKTWVGALAALLIGGRAMAATPVDCPLAHTPYSIDTPLIDLLLDPRTASLLQQHGFKMGPPAFRTTPPTMAAIMTPRIFNGYLKKSAEQMTQLDQALAAVPVTDEAAARRCERYDHTPPALPRATRRPAILVFEKITGFRDDPSVNAARQALNDMAERHGWSLVFTDNGAVFNAKQLHDFDAVVWNNVSGDALTLPQEAAFKTYMEHGGGFAGIHGSGGDPFWAWDWYADTLLGARFIGHPMRPQFQAAKVRIESPRSGITADLPDEWTMTEEWYSFAASPRGTGVHVLATLDEATYNPAELAMGADHPIAWTQCIGSGRAFYTAIGHRPESYVEPNSVKLLEQGIAWAAGRGGTRCKAGQEQANKR